MIRRRFALIGDPVSHSLSPVMHRAAFRTLHLPHEYRAEKAPPSELAATIEGLVAEGCAGFNVTVPHKRSVAQLLDRLDDRAARLGAVNTVEIDRDHDRPVLVGHATDGPGFLAALRELEGPSPTRAAVLGAGGAGHCIVDALVEAFPPLDLTWVTRDPTTIRGLAPREVTVVDWEDFGQPSVELLVNATSVGMRGGPGDFPRPLEFTAMPSEARVIDIVYPRTPFLDRAEASGLRVQDGRGMLLWQGVRALEIWLAMSLDPEVVLAMRSSLDDALTHM